MGLSLLALLLTAGTAGQSLSPAPEKPRLICRQGEQMVGSHIRTPRRCKTEEEWRREEEDRGRLSPDARLTPGQKDPLAKERSP